MQGINTAEEWISELKDQLDVSSWGEKKKSTKKKLFKAITQERKKLKQ